MDARARIGMVTLSVAVAVGSPAAAAEDRRAPVGGTPGVETEAGRAATPPVALPQVGGPAPASPYLPGPPSAGMAGPAIAQPTGPAVPGQEGEATDGVAAPGARDAPPANANGGAAPMPSGLPDGAGFQGTATGLSPDELIEQLKELARRPDILSETAGPAIIREATQPPVVPPAEDGEGEDGDGQP